MQLILLEHAPSVAVGSLKAATAPEEPHAPGWRRRPCRRTPAGPVVARSWSQRRGSEPYAARHSGAGSWPCPPAERNQAKACTLGAVGAVTDVIGDLLPCAHHSFPEKSASPRVSGLLPSPERLSAAAQESNLRLKPGGHLLPPGAWPVGTYNSLCHVYLAAQASSSASQA